MAQHAGGFGVGLRRLELERRTVELVGHIGRMTKAPPHPIGARRQGNAALQEVASVPPRMRGMRVGHEASPLWLFSARCTPCSDSPWQDQNIIEPAGVTLE